MQMFFKWTTVVISNQRKKVGGIVRLLKSIKIPYVGRMEYELETCDNPWIGLEDDLQMELFSRLKDWAKIPELALFLDWIYAVPNGGKRGKREAVKLQQTGTKSGISDIILQFPAFFDGREYTSFCVELKRKTGKPSENQLKFLNFQNLVGAKTLITDSLLVAEQQIMQYVIGGYNKFHGSEVFAAELSSIESHMSPGDWIDCEVEDQVLFDMSISPKHFLKILKIGNLEG